MSPPVLIHCRLLGVAFCLSARPSVTNTRKKSLEKKIKDHKRSRSKVRFTINVKEKAGGLTPTSSCFLFHSGDLVVAPWTDDLWYRGCVLGVKDGDSPLEPQTAHVFFADYGNTASITFDRYYSTCKMSSFLYPPFIWTLIYKIQYMYYTFSKGSLATHMTRTPFVFFYLPRQRSR